MKEVEQPRKEEVWRSFFAVDPENWLDLPPPPTKPRRQRGGYTPRYFGGRLTDDPPRGVPTQILLPESRHAIDTIDAIKVIKGREEQKKQQEENRWKLRKEGIELIRKFKAGEIPHHVASSFYYNHATELIPEKQYEMYQDYRKRKGQEVMPWGDYARLVVPELFMGDFM